MRKIARQVIDTAADATARAYKNAETKVLVAEGRKSIKQKVDTVAKVSRKAVKRGAIAGALVAASVVIREVKKRRKLAR